LAAALAMAPIVAFEDPPGAPIQPSPEPKADVVGGGEPVSTGAGGAPAEEAAPWPSTADESAFLGQRETAPVGAPAAGEPVPEKLPSLDELVRRVPPNVRELLDDMFRAQFSTVRRLAAEKITVRDR
jgi:hypothetical protein